MSTFTRRHLIGSSASLAAGSLISGQSTPQTQPKALRGRVSGDQVSLPPIHTPSEAEGSVPNPDPVSKRLGVAVVGLGHLSLEQILPGFGQTKHVRITALVSGVQAKAKAIAAQYEVPEKNIYNYENYDRLKDNPDVDFVYIVLPNNMHAEYTVRAAQAGKHVLCEKPMANTVAEAERMVQACRDARRKLMIAYRLQYNPAHREIIKLARSKQFGDVRFLTAVNGQNDAANGQWRQIKAVAGGGSLPDIGLYCLSAFRYITGEEPIEVTGQITQPEDEVRFREIEDISNFTLRFPSGIFATGSAGYSYHENRHLRVMATEAWFGLDPAFSYFNLSLQIGRKSGQSSAEEQRHYSPQNQFATEMDHFAERIRANQQPLTPGEEGLQDQKIMAAIYEAAAGGSVVKMPAIKRLDSTRGPTLKRETD